MAWDEAREHSRAALSGAVALPIACALAMFAMRGFSVDDAWIPVRYARHLANGQGYRWNLGSPISDGVTPLPYAALLSLFAANVSAETVLFRARLLNGVGWLVASGALGWALGRGMGPRWQRVAIGACVVLSLPIAAHAVSGLETGLAMALATGAACAFARPVLMVSLAALATTLRPELAPWATTLAFGAAIVRAAKGKRGEPRVIAGAVAWAALALLPWATTFAIRAWLWGSAIPLSLLAKPSDASHGLVYVGAASLAAITPVVAFAPWAAARAGGRGSVLLLSALVHGLVVVVIGGDWMPYARLIAPIAPGLALAASDVDVHAGAASRALRAGAALVLGLVLLVTAAPAGRRVMADRRTLAEAARPWLANATTLVALDIGWPSSIFEGTIVDLAGLTDPAIASLSGGHTSKRIDTPFLLDRNPDVLFFYASGHSIDDAIYTRVVEARLAGSELLREKFVPRAFLPLGSARPTAGAGTGTGYVVWTRR